jgi:uncharacterized protein (DUF4415 family)
MSGKRKKSADTSTAPESMPEITDEWIEGADLYLGAALVRRGRPSLENARKLLSLRLPPEVIARWRASGPGWQTRMAAVLEQHAPSPHLLPEPKPGQHMLAAVTNSRKVPATGPEKRGKLY